MEVTCLGTAPTTIPVQITPKPSPAIPTWWNWGNSSLKLSCVQPNFLQRARQKLPRPTSLNLREHLRLRSCMAHRNARPSNAPRLGVTLHALPATLAPTLGFALLATASPHQFPRPVFSAS